MKNRAQFIAYLSEKQPHNWNEVLQQFETARASELSDLYSIADAGKLRHRIDSGNPSLDSTSTAVLGWYLNYVVEQHHEVFSNDDSAYSGWLAAYPHGTVLNCSARPTNKYLITHSASCPTIAEKVGEAYMKVCATRESGLDSWLAQRGFDDARPHQQCLSRRAHVIKHPRATFMSALPEQATISVPLNQILYGPPGTGKTYHTIDAALEVLDPQFAAQHSNARHMLKQRFDELCTDKRVQLVTFHQSFGYEDFVEGIRAVAHEDGSLSYKTVDGVFKLLCQGAPGPKVLIIDEINRGNISRIFGELITLLEPSKRHGEPEALTVTLPYTREQFSVPNDLYVIGTMNSADRSLAALDLALRRRFTFREMPPRPQELAGVLIDGIDVESLMATINSRIEVLLDGDHRIGHAYFLPLRAQPTLSKLGALFRNQIVPLLQEYFSEDWERISWVLNDHRKERRNRFILEPSIDVSELFGDDRGGKVVPRCWNVNTEAFGRVAAYLTTISHIAGPIERTKRVQAGAVAVQAEYGEYQIRKLENDSIEVFRSGESITPVKPVLLNLARELGVGDENSRGNPFNTRQLGERVILALRERR